MYQDNFKEELRNAGNDGNYIIDHKNNLLVL